MAYKTVYDNVIFIEGPDNRVSIKGKITYTYGSFGSQLKGLNSVKASLAHQAKFKNCNCIVDFNYGQKSSWLSLDDTKWYGDGKCGVLSKEDYDSIINEINSR
ncbi:MAG: hypothetical protein IKP28_03535 [Clostridia bacterium]|nr:hypothetical protein [Clostridia bacterium]